jgi:hypothetical protein
MATFRKGASGNPKGRPRGIEDKRLKLRRLLEPHAEKLVQKAVDLALKGDKTALRLCLERIMPPIKPWEEPVELDGFEGELVEQGRSVLKAMAGGEVSPGQAAGMLQALAAQARIVEVDELERRIRALEERSNDA